ncbi:MAG: SufB/SufD family protein [Candidatus Wenzhouxiangella sp. M2_3B_020]
MDDSDFEPLRRKARKVLMQHGFPHRKTENWKYLPLTLLEKREFASDTSASGDRPDAPRVPFEAGVIHLHNGRIDPDLCRLPDGVTLRPMTPDDVDTEGLQENGPHDAFAWLNLARFARGWTLCVEGTIAQPLLLASTSDDDFDVAAHPRLRLELGEGSALTLVETQQFGGAGLVNLVFDIALRKDARLIHALERRSSETAVIQRTSARLGSGSEYRAFVLDGGGRLTRQDLIARLDHAGAGATLAGVGVLDGRDLVDYHTAIEHRVGGTLSREDFRMLADDHANGVFNGRILIVPGADDSHSEMNTGNLLLSENARINTKPELEIHAEDVTASHGATVGQLDDQARFYLRSRGLDDAQATALLKYGFAAAVFDGLEGGEIKDWLLERLEANL